MKTQRDMVITNKNGEQRTLKQVMHIHSVFFVKPELTAKPRLVVVACLHDFLKRFMKNVYVCMYVCTYVCMYTARHHNFPKAQSVI